MFGFSSLSFESTVGASEFVNHMVFSTQRVCIGRQLPSAGVFSKAVIARLKESTESDGFVHLSRTRFVKLNDVSWR